MNLYIHASSSISPQVDGVVGEMAQLTDAEAHLAIEPGYLEFFTPAMSRRMSRVIKMGVASGLRCLQEAEIQSPNAIITATGYGCFEDSLKFLESLIQNKESILSPTPFIQSTHNTIGAQIALLRSCLGYNNTHVHGGFSFENAIIDCFLYLNDHPNENVLLGAADELTQAYIALKSKEKESIDAAYPNLNLGEGAAFFVVNNQPVGALGVIKKVKTCYKPGKKTLNKLLNEFVDFNPDLILCGEYPLPGNEIDFLTMIQTTFPKCSIQLFKKLCGNYHTSGAFATWMAIQLLKENPQLKNILIANRFDGDQFSFITLGHA